MIDRLRAEFPVTYLCRKLGVSTSGFYDWVAARPTATATRREELRVRVRDAFHASHQAAGYRKVTAALHRQGVPVNRKTVAGIMTELGLRSPAAQRAFRRAKLRAGRVKDPADLLVREFTSATPGTVLVGDITYVPTRQGWLYVATVIDLATRSVLGFATGARQGTDLVIRAMRTASHTGIIHPGAIFHTDHGTQYRSKRFANYCAANGIRRSMGARMQCWDNAAAETFFSKLKSERLDWIDFTTRHHATLEVTAYINHFNTERLHQHLDYTTPAETLARLQPAAA